MTEPIKLLTTLNAAFKAEQRAFVYAGRNPFGAMLVRWSGYKRVVFLRWDTDGPIGRKRLLSAIQRYRSFKGHKVDSWVFIANSLRQNTYRLIDEHKVTLLEVSGSEDALTLLGTKNLPEGMLPVFIRAFENTGLSASYDFDGLVTPMSGRDNQNIRAIATKPAKLTAFISYSWDSDEHQLWVLKLAADLMRSGVNVMVDEWDLSHYGNDLHQFMEAGIRESDFVLMICTSNYAKRANAREGGVGVESSIITGEYYSPESPQKFIPIIRGTKTSECLPSYLKSKLAVLFSDASSYDNSFELLLRRIAGKPRFKKPELGSFPDLPTNDI